MDSMKHIHGGDIYTNDYRIDYSANINPLGTPKSVIEAAFQGILLSANYPDIACRELTGAIERHEGICKDFIICGNGAAELIFSLAAAVRPKRALLAAPGFAEYEQALNTAECEISYYILKEENGFAFGEDYLDMITPELDLLFLCVPNNPTGLTCPKSLMNLILKKCCECGVLMIVDECFNDFLDDGGDYSMLEHVPEYKNLFILKAFTKTYAMAGLRLGYGMCSDLDLLEKMHMVTQPWNISLPAQKAGTAALNETGFVESSRYLIREERGYLITMMKELGLKVFDSKANFIFFYGSSELGEECKQRGILIRDCSNYRGLGKGYYRIAVRTHRENEELIKTLKEIQWTKGDIS